jgi:hypothetical protein
MKTAKTHVMPTELFENLRECRTLGETVELASLYGVAQYLESEYRRAAEKGHDNATELHVKWMKARLAYTYAVQGLGY